MSFVCVADFEQRAQEIIEQKALDYYKSGAGEEFSLNLNKEAFRRLRIRPRCLRDVSKIDLSCQILGQPQKWPVGISPTAMQKLAHPEGEAANARAAGQMGSIFIMSTLSTTCIEDVAAAAAETTKWFQLYVYKDRTLSESLIRRVEKAGFKALVLTIDAPVFGIRRSDVRNNFSMPPHLSLANFDGLKAVCNEADGSGINAYVTEQFDASITWQDIAWLKQKTQLPIIVKGILTREDAILACEYGCAGIIVSNHGGRQLDTVCAPIEVLHEIVGAVGHELTVMMDGGVRQGTDIFKALALGAKYIFMGRPAIWGLACGGQQGVESVLNVVKQELETTLALCGCSRLSDISKEMVVHESYYARL